MPTPHHRQLVLQRNLQTTCKYPDSQPRHWFVCLPLIRPYSMIALPALASWTSTMRLSLPWSTKKKCSYWGIWRARQSTNCLCLVSSCWNRSKTAMSAPWCYVNSYNRTPWTGPLTIHHCTLTSGSSKTLCVTCKFPSVQFEEIVCWHRFIVWKLSKALGTLSRANCLKDPPPSTQLYTFWTNFLSAVMTKLIYNGRVWHRIYKFSLLLTQPLIYLQDWKASWWNWWAQVGRSCFHPQQEQAGRDVNRVLWQLSR